MTLINDSHITDTAQTIHLGYAKGTNVARNFVGALRELEAGVVRGGGITAWSKEGKSRADM